MKTFKIIDTWVSIICIPAFIVFGVITRNERLFYGYFIIGGWQVMSMSIHYFNRWFIKPGGERQFYHRAVFVLVLVIAVLIGLAQMNEYVFIPLLMIMFILLVTSPFMAIYYAFMCYQETYVKMKRPMELLK